MVRSVSHRVYNLDSAVSFRKTKDAFGGLSNMCGGFPLVVNGIPVKTSEAIYQALRFPSRPDIQELILKQSSPMTAKMKSKPYRHLTRDDWDLSRVKIMRWALQVKLAQNFEKFGRLLEESYPRPIVENSRKDSFWGAIPQGNGSSELVGTNALGRLLMELRQAYMGPNRYDLLYVKSLEIAAFNLLDERISNIDERAPFLTRLSDRWRLAVSNQTTSRSADKVFILQDVKSDLTILGPDKLDREDSLQIEDSQLEERIVDYLTTSGPANSKNIIRTLGLKWNSSHMSKYLKSVDGVVVHKSKPLTFSVVKDDSKVGKLKFN